MDLDLDLDPVQELGLVGLREPEMLELGLVGLEEPEELELGLVGLEEPEVLELGRELVLVRALAVTLELAPHPEQVTIQHS